LDLSYGAAQHIGAVLGNKLGRWGSAIELNKLAVLVYHKCNEVVLDLSLVLSLN